MRITDYCKQKIRDAADVVDVLSDFLDLKKVGTTYKCCCPFHGEKTPSFTVNPRKNFWYCFGCHEGGDSIEFLMKHQHMDFIEALHYIAKKYNINVEYDRREQSAAEIEASRKTESAMLALETVQRYYIAQFNADTPDARAAREYAYGRWGKEYCEEVGIGYAPKGNALLVYAKQHQMPLPLMFELGIFCKNEDNGNEYVLLRNRITIPIRNRWGKVIAFTARDMEQNPVAKYMNSPTSFLFAKEKTIFGLHAAIRQARTTNSFILVEGAPDVLRLHAIGLNEAVAPLGTALTKTHLEQLHNHCKTLRFIPDCDPPKNGAPWGAGVAAVMKNGRTAMEQGFDVYVREIPTATDANGVGIKQDPDSYITSPEIYRSLEEKHFTVWLGEKLFAETSTIDSRYDLVRDIASLLVLIEDKMIQEMCVERLKKIFGTKKNWTDAISQASRKLQEEVFEEKQQTGESQKEMEFRRKAGIIIRNNCYQVPGKGEQMERVSNFILRPDFHIKDPNVGLRKFTIINEYNQRETLEIQQRCFSSVQSFQVAVESLGNYVWLGKQEHLNQVKEYLYGITDSVDRISTLGWQDKYKFFAFSDGIHTGERFISIDPKGIVSYGDNMFYLPAYSDTYGSDLTKYSYEKQLCYLAENPESLREFVTRLITVFGDGAKVGFAFVVACLFRDHIYKLKDWFPILNIFGIFGSGKSALAAALNSFFFSKRQEASKLGITSIPSMTMILESVNNGIVLLDEYTNLLKPNVINFLKALWGGTTNTRLSINDGQRDVAMGIVRSGIILMGQHQPNADPALFSRCIHIAYFRNDFTAEEGVTFNALKEATKLGNAHLAMQIMRHRDVFTARFADTYSLTHAEVKERLVGEKINERIINNWVVALAAFRTLDTYLDVPFSYAELFEICVKGIRSQNREADKSSETGDFWQMINALYMNGKIIGGAHFAIKYQAKFKNQKTGDVYNFAAPRKLLYLNWSMVQDTLRSRTGANQMKMDIGALDNYLRHVDQFLGSRQKRFTVLTPQGNPDEVYEGMQKKQKTAASWAMVFDYDALKNAYSIDLEATTDVVAESDDDDDDSTSSAQSTQPLPPITPTATQEELPF